MEPRPDKPRLETDELDLTGKVAVCGTAAGRGARGVACDLAVAAAVVAEYQNAVNATAATSGGER